MVDTIHHIDETGLQVKNIILKEDFCFQNVSYQEYIIVALFPGGSEGKESACNEGDQGSIPGSGRPPGKENGYPLQYSCLEIPWTKEPGELQFIRSQRVRPD